MSPWNISTSSSTTSPTPNGGGVCFKLMQGYGEWVQLSVFQCRLSRRRHAALVARIDDLIDHGADHVVLVDVGVADGIEPRVVSLGKAFQAVRREPVIV